MRSFWWLTALLKYIDALLFYLLSLNNTKEVYDVFLRVIAFKAKEHDGFIHNFIDFILESHLKLKDLTGKSGLCLGLAAHGL